MLDSLNIISPNIEVSVEVHYLDVHSSAERRVFAYMICIENRSEETWQLLSRHWDIVDATGRATSVDGEGVVGEQPVLPPGGTFVYDSFVTVEALPGNMGGYYTMQDAWGQMINVPIPVFGLMVPEERILN